MSKNKQWKRADNSEYMFSKQIMNGLHHLRASVGNVLEEKNV